MYHARRGRARRGPPSSVDRIHPVEVRRLARHCEPLGRPARLFPGVPSPGGHRNRASIPSCSLPKARQRGKTPWRARWLRDLRDRGRARDSDFRRRPGEPAGIDRHRKAKSPPERIEPRPRSGEASLFLRHPEGPGLLRGGEVELPGHVEGLLRNHRRHAVEDGVVRDLGEKIACVRGA